MPLNKPMRVAYVVKRYPRYSETFIVNEILAHERAGLDVVIYSLRPPNDTHFQDIVSQVRAPVHCLPSAGVKAANFWDAVGLAAQTIPNLWARLESARDDDALDVYQAVRLAHDLTLQGATHIHAHFGSSPTAVARLASLFTGIPYTFTAHAKDIFHEDVRHDDLKRKLRDAASVVTVSDFNVEFLKAHYGPDADRVVRVYNGLDLDRFEYQAPHHRRPRIVSVGRLVEKKGFEDLIDACALLAGRGHSFDCRIIGTGPLEADLRARIQRLGLTPVVTLIGPRPQREVVRLVQETSAFAAPCVVGEDGNRDGLPTVLLEAMALGTPCVATDVTGIPEIIHDQRTGLLVPQRDPEALAHAMERLLRDTAVRVGLANQARRLIQEQFDVNKNAAQVRALFTEAASRDRQPAQEVSA